MFLQLLQYQDIGWLILRLAVAAIFLYHAFPKLTRPASMAPGLGFPVAGVILLGMVESLSSLGLILGVYPRIASFFLGCVMLGAISFKIFKWHVPFNAPDKTGWEFDFILLAANIMIILGGGGTIKIF
jgi:uncharacterized membrane protein YphA (DoxX/SURF4 family)